jgi:hypothetical protein
MMLVEKLVIYLSYFWDVILRIFLLRIHLIIIYFIFLNQWFFLVDGRIRFGGF